VPGPISAVVDPLEPARSACGQTNAMKSSRVRTSNAERILFFMGRNVAELTSKTPWDKPPLQQHPLNAVWGLNFSSLFRNHGLEEDVTFAGFLCN